MTESFLFGFSATSHLRLANDNGFATVCFKIGHKLTSNEAHKVGLVTDFDHFRSEFTPGPSSRMPGNHIHGNGLPATFVLGRRNVCEGYWAVEES